jgi:hypothetical protein
MKSSTYIILILLLFTGILNATRYYVDAVNGNDANLGKSENSAWQTLARVNNPFIPFNANDTISFKCGQRFLTNGTTMQRSLPSQISSVSQDSPQQYYQT